jgi:hypothetical protein
MNAFGVVIRVIPAVQSGRMRKVGSEAAVGTQGAGSSFS